jgi:hypothetical protein
LQEWVPEETPDHIIDHRYFYEVNGIGRCVSGAVRDAVTRTIHTDLKAVLWNTEKALDGILRSIKN